MENIIVQLKNVDIAFFDLDETLTDRDTDSLWAAWRSCREIKGWLERLWLAKLYRNFRRGALDAEEYVRYQRYRIGTLSPRAFHSLAERFFLDAGARHLYQEALTLIPSIRRSGIRAVLLTAQHEHIAAPFARYLGMDDMLANRFGEERDRFTEPVKPYTFGEGKVHHGYAYASRLGVPLSRCAFFGDSIYDAPFMERVGYPFAVNPDMRLKRLAKEKGWAILTFGRGRT